MRHVFLTACRNEEGILPEFLREFTEVVQRAGIASSAFLYVIDDLSTDRSVEILEEYGKTGAIPLDVIRAPTNLGNQGAMFFALSKITLEPDDILLTFDCDGEDDVREIPSILALGAANPGKLVLIERGSRQESLTFRVAFFCYKLLFRYLTGQTVIPNNFLLMPGRYVPFVQRTPLAAVHFAYAVLKTKFPSVATQRNRRTRYGGHSSQNLFMVASHGLVGIMIFYETVVAKLLLQLMLFSLFSLAVVGLALMLPENVAIQRTLLWLSVAMAGLGLGFFSLLLAGALAMIFKMVVFTLSRATAEGREEQMTPGSRSR
jgi:glycosyltransferase involved in cell wall biosynthesis